MEIEQIAVGPLSTNCYIITCNKSGQSVIVDPGGISDILIQKVKDRCITAILLTHGHFDHTLGVSTIVDMTDAPIMIHNEDAAILNNPVKNGSYLLGIEMHVPDVTKFLSNGDVISFGETHLTVACTPGHSSGSVSFVSEDKFTIAGDTLFRLSVGRWDLPGGDYNTLIKTLHHTFLPMPDEMVVYPGHGESTTIGFEKIHNQFLQSL